MSCNASICRVPSRSNATAASIGSSLFASRNSRLESLLACIGLSQEAERYDDMVSLLGWNLHGRQSEAVEALCGHSRIRLVIMIPGDTWMTSLYESLAYYSRTQVKSVKALAELKLELTVEERNLLSGKSDHVLNTHAFSSVTCCYRDQVRKCSFIYFISHCIAVAYKVRNTTKRVEFRP